MKLRYFFGRILAAPSLAVWPEIGLAHGGGGHGGGGGGHAFVGGGGHAFGGFTGRGFSPGFSGTRGFSTGRFSGRGDRGRWNLNGFIQKPMKARTLLAVAAAAVTLTSSAQGLFGCTRLLLQVRGA